MDFYGFFNSSTSWRVRIALGLKGLKPELHGVNIRVDEHRDVRYVSNVNPSAVVPAIVEGDFNLGQSLAIIDWLDVKYPQPLLIPTDDVELRARVLEFSCLIACDIHPVNNLRILKYLQGVLKLSDEQKNAWYEHWAADGMAAAERMLARAQASYGGPWCFGDAPTLADCCLIPQVANARRSGCVLSAYPLVNAVCAHAATNPAFIQAEPKNQPDYVAPCHNRLGAVFSFRG